MGLGTKDQLELLERIDRFADLISNQASSVAELAAGLKLNSVLYSGTKTIDASGRTSVEAHVNFAAVTVLPAGADVTISTQGDSGAAPTVGPGVHVIKGGVERTVPLAGNVLVVYGTPGATVSIVLWVRAQPPSSASTHGQSADVVAAGIVRVGAAVATTVIAAANPARRGLLLFNESTATLYLAFAPAASTIAYTVQIAPGAYYEIPGPRFYRGAVSGIWTAANGAVLVTELI